jgi:hypothetical protein
VFDKLKAVGRTRGKDEGEGVVETWLHKLAMVDIKRLG